MKENEKLHNDQLKEKVNNHQDELDSMKLKVATLKESCKTQYHKVQELEQYVILENKCDVSETAIDRQQRESNACNAKLIEKILWTEQNKM